MFLTLLVSVVCIFLMMVPGVLAFSRAWLNNQSLQGLSRINVYVLYPCLIFSVIVSNFTFTSLLKSWYLPAISFGIMSVGYIAGLVACSIFNIRSRETHKSFLFQSAINNYSFFPLALVITLFGSEGTGILIFSTLGAELAVWTLGMFILSGHSFNLKSLLHLLSPPMMGLYLAVLFLALCRFFDFDPAFLSEKGTPANSLFNAVKMLSGAVVPISMIIAGARISKIKLAEVMNRLVWILTALRLVVIPLFAVMTISILPIDDLSKKIMMIVAVMPVSLASMLLSEIYGGDKEFIDGTVLLSHLLSMLTAPAILAFVI
jgi:malate permease and related proteins